MGIYQKGYFKYSVTDSEGNTHITGFSFCDTPLGDYSSLVLKTPAVTDIIAATDAEVLVCNRNIVDELFEKDFKLHCVISDGFFTRHMIGFESVSPICEGTLYSYIRILS